MRQRILIWTQHLLGTGHFMRARLIAEALRDGGNEVALVSGGVLPATPHIEGVRFVQLPAVRAKNELFDELVDEHGEDASSELLVKRRQLLLELYTDVQPHVVITETFPFGRRLLQDELLALVDAIRLSERRPKLVSSVRDVLQRPRKNERALAMIAYAGQHYDGILVHSDPNVIRAETAFPELSALQHMLRYTGYVCRRLAVDDSCRSEVIVSAGGGAVGAALLEMALAAKPLTSLQHLPWTIVAGPHGKLPTSSVDGVTIVRSLPDFQLRLSRAALSISQAGYNTICETLSARTPSVVVPFETDREREQMTRSVRLEEMGLLTLIRHAELSAPKLAASADEAVRRGRSQHKINFDGMNGTVSAIASFLE